MQCSAVLLLTNQSRSSSVCQQPVLQAQLEQRHAHIQAVAGLAEVGGAGVTVHLRVDLQGRQARGGKGSNENQYSEP